MTSALVTNTMIYEASRFLENPTADATSSSVESISGSRFLDFSSLVEAILIHDDIRTVTGIEATPDGPPRSLTLRFALTRSDILKENSVPLELANIRTQIIEACGQQRFFAGVQAGYIHVDLRDQLPSIFSTSASPPRGSADTPYARRAFLNALDNPASQRWLGQTENIYEFLRSSSFVDFLSGTGQPERAGYLLRALVYLQAAHDRRMTFFPDYARIPFVASATNSLSSTVPMKIYNEFAKKLDCELTDLLSVLNPIRVPLPPFTSMLLSRCKSSDDVIPQLLSLRDEFGELRQRLDQMENERLGCQTLRERSEWNRHFNALFQAISAKFAETRYTTFATSLSLVEKGLKPFYSPLNPLSYSSQLLLQPIDFIRRWWLLRPVNHFFSVHAEVQNIRNYDRLLENVFKVGFSSEQSALFQERHNKLSDLFRVQNSRP